VSVTLAAPFARAQPLEPITLYSNLAFPAGIAFAEDGAMFFTEREGRVRRVQEGRLDPEPIAQRETSTSGETGFLGIAVAPNDSLYVFATDPDGDGNSVLRVGPDGGEMEEVLTDLPGGTYHNGGGLAFDRSGALLISNGEIHDGYRAQDPAELGGKIYRVDANGEPLPDNPFGGDSMTYALGLRNPFGVAIDPVSGDLFVTENGPSSNDEVNHILPGANYGWPVVQGEVGEVDEIEATLPGRYRDPLLDYPEIIVPTGITFAPTGRAAAGYSGDLFFGSFKERTIHHVSLDDDRELVSDDILLQEMDPVIALAWGPRGLYYSTPTSIKLLPLAASGNASPGGGGGSPDTGAPFAVPGSREPTGIRIDRLLLALGAIALLGAVLVARSRSRATRSRS
jgi:glucose/arabinose dehydrogenase